MRNDSSSSSPPAPTPADSARSTSDATKTRDHRRRHRRRGRRRRPGTLRRRRRCRVRPAPLLHPARPGDHRGLAAHPGPPTRIPDLARRGRGRDRHLVRHAEPAEGHPCRRGRSAVPPSRCRAIVRHEQCVNQSARAAPGAWAPLLASGIPRIGHHLQPRTRSPTSWPWPKDPEMHRRCRRALPRPTAWSSRRQAAWKASASRRVQGPGESGAATPRDRRRDLCASFVSGRLPGQPAQGPHGR